MTCAYCGERPEDPLNYVQLTAQVPGHSAYQNIGAHFTCIQPSLHPGYRLDEDILHDR